MSEIKVEKVTEKELKKLGIESWSPWGCDISTFDWQYPDNETAYIHKGHVIVETATGKTEIKAGDLVHFPKGLKCVWHVKEPIEKVFKFD